MPDSSTNYQAIILATGLGNRLYPLINNQYNNLKSLIPVCNLPVIKYTIDLLQYHSFSSCIIVCRQLQLIQLQSYIHTMQHHPIHDTEHNTDRLTGMDIQLIGVDNNIQGTCDALRDIASHIYTNYILLPCDLITTVSLHSLIDVHRLYNTAVACMITNNSAATNTKTKPCRSDSDSADNIYVGLDHNTVSTQPSDNTYKQILLYSSVADIDETYTINKQLLRQHPSIRLYKQYVDSHIYVFSYWTIQLLCDKPNILTVQNDFVPYLIRNQYKASMKVWLDEHSISITHSITDTNNINSMQSTYNPINNTTLNNQCNYKCYVCITPSTSLCIRACTSIKSYIHANYELCNDTQYTHQPYGSSSQYNYIDQCKSMNTSAKIQPQCYIDKNVMIGTDSIIKRCIIGNNVQIGTNCKLSNCIVLSDCVINDNCKLDDCILSRHTVIHDNTKLNNVKIGGGYVVPANTELKNDSLSTDTSTAHF